MTWTTPVPQPPGTPYGKAGSMWSSGAHTGLDFPAPTGTAVAATAPGRVTYAGDTGGSYGRMVKVRHSAGLETWYAHLSAVSVQRGQIIGAGDTLGAVGSTGNTTGPHLHLEVRVNGQHRDPAPYLSGSIDAGPSSPTFPGAAPAGILPDVDDLVSSVRGLTFTALFVAGGFALVALGLARAAAPAVEKVTSEITQAATDAAQIAATVHPAGRAATAASIATKG